MAPSRRRPHIARAAALALLAAALPAAGHGQPAQPPSAATPSSASPPSGTSPAPGTGNGVRIVPLQELEDGDTLGERAERLWSDFLDLFQIRWRHSSYVPSQPAFEQSRQQVRADFGALMDIAGYKLKEIESQVGIVPGLQMTFAQVRELTEADREYVERHLDRHSHRYPGALAAIQRTIVLAVVEASDIAGFSVEKVVIDIFPLPEVKFVLASVDAPLSVDTARIMRAIDGVNQRLQHMAPSESGGAQRSRGR